MSESNCSENIAGFQMESLYAEMMQKSQTLSSWTRERVDSVSRLAGAWERLQSLLENYQYIMAKQVHLKFLPVSFFFIE